MKNILHIFVLFLTVFAISCDDSFLEENKKQLNGYDLDAPLFVQPVSEYIEASVTLPNLKNKDFKVFQFPKIIHFETFNGHIDETGKLTFKIKVDEYDNPVRYEPQNLGYIILDVEEFGFLSINVQSVNWGTPKATLPQTLIDFDISRENKLFSVENFANGFLFYKLIKKPSWLQVSKSAWTDDIIKEDDVNYIEPNRSSTFSVIPNIEGLSAGTHEGQIIFETSDPANSILKIDVKIRIRTYENPETMIPIDGIVLDAEFDKSTNTAVYITKNPSKLISFNTDTKLKKEITLDKSPYCISLSGDGKTVFLGEGGQVEAIELSTLVIKEKIPLPYIVTDIVDGENGCIYFTNNESELFSYNTSTKTIMRQKVFLPLFNSEIKGNVLTKVKTKSHLFLSYRHIGGYGLALLDTSAPEELKYLKYWHESFEGKLSVSEDLKYLFAGVSPVYSLPDETTGETLYEIGSLKDKEKNEYIRFNFIHHSSVSSSIWGAYLYYDQYLYKEKGRLLEFSDKTFDEKRKIELNDYVTTINGKKDYYSTIAPFFFATKDGGKLLLIKNVAERDANAWHLEIIDVSK